MPNYLQRVLSYGARTTSPAKPPAFADPGIPPVKASAWAPPGEVNLRPFEGTDMERPGERTAVVSAELQPAFEAEGERSTRHAEISRAEERNTSLVPPKAQPATDRPTSAPSAEGNVSPESVSAQAEPTSSAEAIPVAPPVATVIRVPKGMRRTGVGNERRSAMMDAIEQTLSTVAPRATESAPAMPNAREANSRLSRTESPRQVQSKPAPASPAPMLSPAIVQPPVGESTVAQAEIQTTRQTASAEPVSTAEVELRTPPSKIERLPAQRASERDATPAQPMFDREKREAHLFELPAKPPQPATRPALPASSDRQRRSQISIGRIDVQVNTVPAAAEAAPRPARTQAYSNFLEA